MLTSSELRRKVGCWSCINSKVNDSVCECNSPDPSVRKAFNGWPTALTCKGYQMIAYSVDVNTEEGQK